MRRTRTTRAKIEARNRRHDSGLSFSENEMTGLGLFASSAPSYSSSSSSSSSNLSPLALPFTVERSNPGKFSFGSNIDSHFNFNGKSDGLGFSSPSFQSSTTAKGLLADSIKTATVPSTYSTHNRSSIPSVSLSVIGPNQRVTDASSSSPFNTHNWSSMNSSVKSGLEHINPPASYLFGVNPNLQPHNWSLGDDGSSDDDSPLMPLNFDLPGYGSSQVSYSQSLSGSKYSDGSRGKQDSSLFGASVTRESNIEPSIIGKSHGTLSPATCDGVVSSGLSNEHTFTWNGCTSCYPFEKGSIFYDSSSDHLSPSMTTKSPDISSPSPFYKTNVSVSHKPLKEKESYQLVGYEYTSSLSSQVPDVNSTEDVNSSAHLSAHLDHHNPGEDSPCWKGAPTQFSSSGSEEQESSQHTMKKMQKNSGEDVLLHMDQSLHGSVGNASGVVTSDSSDVNMVVKALNNLSELLLCLHSKDECGLMEQDHKTLDHVIANLNVCLSRKNQQVDPAQKCPLSQQITSNMLHEERNKDQFGKNIEELRSAYERDVNLTKDDNMVQKIKRVLDENLEFKEDLPSDPLSYKNLWLEAEAELCVCSYKTRLLRAKREMSNSKASEKEPADVKASGNKIQSSGVTEKPHLRHLLDTDDAVMVHSHCNQKMQHPLAIEDAVMTRFNILKSRGGMDDVNAEQRVLADGARARAQVPEEGVGKA